MTQEPHASDVPEAAALFINRQTCAATRTCTRIAPSLFEYDEVRGFSRPLEEVVEVRALVALALEARDACPTSSIVVQS